MFKKKKKQFVKEITPSSERPQFLDVLLSSIEKNPKPRIFDIGILSNVKKKKIKSLKKKIEKKGEFVNIESSEIYTNAAVVIYFLRKLNKPVLREWYLKLTSSTGKIEETRNIMLKECWDASAFIAARVLKTINILLKEKNMKITKMRMHNYFDVFIPLLLNPNYTREKSIPGDVQLMKFLINNYKKVFNAEEVDMEAERLKLCQMEEKKKALIEKKIKNVISMYSDEEDESIEESDSEADTNSIILLPEKLGIDNQKKIL